MKSRKLSYYFKEEKLTTFLVVFFGIVFNVSQIISPYFLGKMIDSIASNSELNVIILNCVIYLGVVTIIQLLRFFKRFTVRLFASKTSRRMRSIMYKNTINESIADLEKHSIGDLMARCITDVDYSVEGIRKSLTEIFDTGVLMTSYFITLMLYDYKATLIGSIFIPLSILIAYLLKSKIYSYSKEYRKEASIMNEMTYEMIDHAKDYRNFGSIDKAISDYDIELKNIKTKAIKANLLEGSMEPMYKAIASLGIFFVIYYGAMHVINKDTSIIGIWTIGMFSAYLKLFVGYVRKASKVSKLLNTVEKAKISYNRISGYLIDKEEENNTKREIPNGDLIVSNLSFGYDDNKIINNMSFTCKPGDIIGVTGGIASGKSTLGIALLGLFDYSGSIKLSGYELNNLSSYEKSKLISYLGHTPYLLSDSIKNNILLGDNKDITNVINDTALAKDISFMSEKENTLIGAGGVKTSGGQQQRIALARALLNKNNLIILDDPFQASDMKTEQEIITAIRNNYKDSIIILISHRLTVFPYTNHVLFLDNNNYYYETHNDLLNKSELYKKIYTIQTEGDLV